jgi:hypothetical protein
MEKRTEQKKHKVKESRDKLKKVFAILFCAALLAFLINIADMSTRRMIMCTDDKYAMAVSIEEGKLLRLDIAGEKLLVDIEPVVRATDGIISNTKKYYGIISESIRTKLGKD